MSAINIVEHALDIYRSEMCFINKMDRIIIAVPVLVRRILCNMCYKADVV